MTGYSVHTERSNWQLENGAFRHFSMLQSFLITLLNTVDFAERDVKIKHTLNDGIGAFPLTDLQVNPSHLTGLSTEP